jgi:hypothetical protein
MAFVATALWAVVLHMTDSSRVDRLQADGYSKLRPDFIHEFIPVGSSRTLLLRHGIGGNERVRAEMF